MPATRPRRRPTAAPGLFADVEGKEARLLQAALELFVEKGFHGTTIPEIARRAGVATGTVYLYFDGKERLVNAILARVKGRLTDQLLAEVPRETTIRAQFDAIWRVFARFSLEQERAMAFCDLHNHAPYITAETLATWEPGRRLLDAHFRKGRAEGVYRPLAPALLRAVVAGALFGVHKFARAGELSLTPATLDQAREAAWAAVAARETETR
jgi:TetR/AcrR family transcriptional regulator, repressor of fatR-cypB operon